MRRCKHPVKRRWYRATTIACLHCGEQYEDWVRYSEARKLESECQDLSTRVHEAADRWGAEVKRVDGLLTHAFVAYPDDRPPRYNGSGEPCDMLVGPCCCGATHTGDCPVALALQTVIEISRKELP